MTSQVKFAAYYFPNYHFDPRNEAFHGPGWNEWTEGSYLEPDEEHGFAFLDEIARTKNCLKK